MSNVKTRKLAAARVDSVASPSTTKPAKPATEKPVTPRTLAAEFKLSAKRIRKHLRAIEATNGDADAFRWSWKPGDAKLAAVRAELRKRLAPSKPAATA